VRQERPRHGQHGKPGARSIALDARQGEEVIGVYPGPLVVVRTAAGMRQIHVRSCRDGEIIIATGAAEIQPVAPGNQTGRDRARRAAEQMLAAGLDLGRLALVGQPADGWGVTGTSGRV
jgi:hypothetical protein